MDGWMDGRMGGWMEAKAGLRIAYSNQKLPPPLKHSAIAVTTHPRDIRYLWLSATQLTKLSSRRPPPLPRNVNSPSLSP